MSENMLERMLEITKNPKKQNKTTDCPIYLPRQCGTFFTQKWDNLEPSKHSKISFANYSNGCYDQTIGAYCLFQNLQHYNSQFFSVHRSQVQDKGLNFYFP